MTFYIENETEVEFPGTSVSGTDGLWEAQETARAVCEAVLKSEGCPWEAQVSLVITDREGIRECNREMRGLDQETDVLSFPNLDFARAGEFRIEAGREADYFDPDSGEVILGDIMICAQAVREQAEKYGHSLRREFAFLVAHSMFHLCGYDHVEKQEAEEMERKQEAILESLGISRDDMFHA